MMLGTNTLVLLLVISSQLTQGAVDEDDECHITATKLLKKLSKCHGQKTDEMNIFLEIQAVKSEILEELSTIKKMLRNNNNNHCAQPAGLKWINTGGKKYFFSDIQASWYDSKDFCSKNGAQLASVKSEIEMEELHKKIQTLKNRANQYFWTSANDIGMSGKFVWNDGTPLLNSSKLWHIGETYQEPNEFGRGRETCVNVNSGFLYDFQCNGDLFYICEFTGST